jgi:hypothetical protein
LGIRAAGKCTERYSWETLTKPRPKLIFCSKFRTLFDISSNHADWPRPEVDVTKDDDEAARTERARRIGLFRYMLIREAADPSLTGRQRGALVRSLAQQEHIDADGRPVRISHGGRWTAGSWSGARAASTRWCPLRASPSPAPRPRWSSWRWC